MDTASTDTFRFEEAIEAASQGKDVLYHGTRSASAILKDDVIRKSPLGQIAVSFTSSPRVAAYWALLNRGEVDEDGAVLIVDRTVLARRYMVENFHDPIWDNDCTGFDEQELRVSGMDVTGLRSMLVAVVRP